MYRCDNCNTVFDEPKQYEEKHNLDAPPYERYMGCPECGSSEYEEFVTCDRCGEYIACDDSITVGTSRVCEICYDEMFR